MNININNKNKMLMFIYVLWFEAYTIVKENLRKSLKTKKKQREEEKEQMNNQWSTNVDLQSTKHYTKY